MNRGLSGFYIRAHDENGQWVSVCFEDALEEEQKKYINTKVEPYKSEILVLLNKTLGKLLDSLDSSKESDDAIDSVQDELALFLARKIKEIGDKFDIVSGNEE